jgi:hypothetical protein
MFLIGLLFAAGIVWKAGEAPIAEAMGRPAAWVLALLVLVIPANAALQALRPLSFADDAGWLTVLVDVERSRDLGSLPNADVTSASLEQIRRAVAEAQGQGDVLFMDQRQLLTFDL